MQILKIILTEDDKDRLFNNLTLQFKIQDEPQEIHSLTGFDIEWFATLELYTQMTDPDENNQNHIYSRSVMKFDLRFYNSDGEQIEVEDWDIDDRISRYYEI